MARGHKVEARLKRRAQIVLLCWEKLPCSKIGRRLGTSESQVRKWRTRFLEDGVEGGARKSIGIPKADGYC